LGNTLTSTYNSQNQLLTQTLVGTVGDGAAIVRSDTTRYVYDASGQNQLRFVISAEGRVTEHRYNGLGLRVSTLEYAVAGYDLSALATTDAPIEAQMQAWAATQDLSSGQRTEFTYDFRGQLQTSAVYGTLNASGTGSQAATTQYVYSQAGELLKTIEPQSSGVTQFTYDGLGRLIARSAPSADGISPNLTTTDYGDAQQRVTLKQANNLTTISTYDSAGRLISVQQVGDANADLGTTQYFYDAVGRLISTVDPTGVRQWMLYDAAGRKVADIHGSGAVIEYLYNANGQITETIAYANKLSSTSEQPTLSTIHALADVSDRKSWRVYDSAQRLAWQIDAQGYVTRTEYDSASRIVSVTQLATPISTSALGDGSTLQVQNGVLTTVSLPTSFRQSRKPGHQPLPERTSARRSCRRRGCFL
jgi:YD repeat-containing protein